MAVSENIQQLKDAGVEINDDVDKDAFRSAVKPLVDDFLASADDKTKALYNAIVTVRDEG